MTAWRVTVEGIEGAGKTYLSRMAAILLGGRCRLTGEITDQQDSALAHTVITALSRTGDLWLRTGHPVTETLALLALKAAAYEYAARENMGPAELVLEDRGIDTVAVYQALILAGPGAPGTRLRELADLVYDTARRYLPPPDLTLLITDDPGTCAARLEQRTGRRLTDGDRALMAGAASLYERQAAREPGRIRVIGRVGRTADETAQEMATVCTRLLTGKEAMTGA